MGSQRVRHDLAIEHENETQWSHHLSENYQHIHFSLFLFSTGSSGTFWRDILGPSINGFNLAPWKPASCHPLPAYTYLSFHTSFRRHPLQSTLDVLPLYWQPHLCLYLLMIWTILQIFALKCQALFEGLQIQHKILSPLALSVLCKKTKINIISKFYKALEKD